MFNLLNALVRYNSDVPSTAQMSKCSSLSPFTAKEEYSILIEMGGACVNVSDNNEELITLILSTKEERVSIGMRM